jgi:hypothetical protein
VLEEGRIKAQGAPAEIEQQKDSLFAEGLAERLQEECPQRKTIANQTAEFASEEEEKEEPIAKASLGLTPYLFFARMATWENTALCVVGHFSILVSSRLIFFVGPSCSAGCDASWLASASQSLDTVYYLTGL